MSYEILSLVCNYAKINTISAIINGYGLQITHFCVGDGGHDQESPINSLTPDPNLNPTPAASGHRLPEDLTFGPKLITSSTFNTDLVPIWTCDLDKGEGTGELSSIYLLAQFVYPPSHPSINLLFIYSISYSALSVKSDNASWTLDIGIQF